MAKRQYVCAYKYCLHRGERVLASKSVVMAKKHYHLDCAEIKQKIKECVDLYMSYIDDNTQYPSVTKIINTLVHKNRVPIEYIRKHIESSRDYYANKPVYILYGLRKLFWTKECRVGGH